MQLVTFNSKKLLTVLTWILLNGSIAAFLYFGFVHQIEGALNVGLYFVWFSFVISLLNLSDDWIKILAEESSWFPGVDSNISLIFSLSLTGFLVWHDAYWAGTACLIGEYHHQYAINEVEKIRKTKSNASDTCP